MDTGLCRCISQNIRSTLCRCRRRPKLLAGLVITVAALSSFMHMASIANSPDVIYKRIQAASAILNNRTMDVKSQMVSASGRVVPNTRITKEEKWYTSVYSDGFNLSKLVQKRCAGSNEFSYHSLLKLEVTRLHAVIQTKDRQLQLCPVWKVGTTFIRRVFLIKDDTKFKDQVNPYNISFSVKSPPYAAFMSPSPSVKKFLFVRNPYHRIFSCYVDKLLAPNPYYWDKIGIPAIRHSRVHPNHTSLRCGHDLTFPEFVKYVTAAVDNRNRFVRPDPHFMPIQELCKPCRVKYDYIGTLENFKREYPVLIESLNLTRSKEMLALLEKEGDEAGAIDAIADSIHIPFDAKTEENELFKGCMSRVDVLKRAWKKMQIRGLIGTESLAISEDEAAIITENEFLEMAKASRQKSSKEERHQLKQNYFFKHFKEVDIHVLDSLRLAYFNDFRLFGYDDKPKALFDFNTTSNSIPRRD